MRVIIVGAGLTGLSLAYFLSKFSKYEAIVLEREENIGGLAKTFIFDNLIFDSGPHRFHTKKREIEHLFLSLFTTEEIVKKNKKSSIFFKNRWLNYPIKISDVMFKLNYMDSILSFLSYFHYKLKKHFEKPVIKNFEDFIIFNFGKKLNEIYFKPYTEKVWGISESKISVDWAKQRIPLSSFTELFLKTFSFSIKKYFSDAHPHSPYESIFYYVKNGIGELSKRLINKKITLKTNFSVKNVNIKNKKILSVTNDKEEISGDIFVFTNPITEISKSILNYKCKKLRYLDDKMFFIPVEKEKISQNHWIYFPDKKIIFNRITEMKNFTSIYPKNRTSLIIECNNLEMEDRQMFKEIVKELKQMDLIGDNEVKDDNFLVKHIKNAYPVFVLNYDKERNMILQKLYEFENLYIGGRQGLFSYINMDQAMEIGIKIAREIVKKYG